MSEQWRPIPGWEGYYEASDQGNVRSLDRLIVDGRGRKLRCPGKKLRQRISRAGYPILGLSRDGAVHSCRVHSLVCKAFRGLPQPGQEVRHLNGDKTDNRLENLIWGDRFEQRMDDVRNGVHAEARKTHCPQGHLFDEANTIRTQRGPGRFARSCRTCKRTRRRLWRLEHGK